MGCAQVLVQLGHLELELDDFLLGQQVERAVLLHGLELLHTVDALTDGAEVGHHAAQPASVDIVHAAAGSLVTDGLLSLLLGADEQDLAALCSGVADEVVSLIELLHGLLQVNDVDTIALGEDVLSHLGVPAAGLVAEVDTGLEKLFHRYDCHCLFPPKNLVCTLRTAGFLFSNPFDVLPQKRHKKTAQCVCIALV